MNSVDRLFTSDSDDQNTSVSGEQINLEIVVGFDLMMDLGIFKFENNRPFGTFETGFEIR